MLAGYFMTLIDWTAVSVANPSIMAALHVDYDSVVWVTSAYLLGFAVPLMVAGRLGDWLGLIPVLPTSRHRFDVIGVVLSGVGLFLIVFALQEVRPQHGSPWIWAMFAAGAAMMAAFVYWHQHCPKPGAFERLRKSLAV
jgi:MFS family permease